MRKQKMKSLKARAWRTTTSRLCYYTRCLASVTRLCHQPGYIENQSGSCLGEASSATTTVVFLGGDSMPPNSRR